MIPESFEAESIRLYRALDFPTKWEFVKELRTGEQYVDSSVFRFRDLWWMYTSATANDILRLFYAELITGPWVEHPHSPIVSGDPSIARPGGRVVVFDGRVVRYAQDCRREYGGRLRAFEIVELTTSTYGEVEAEEDPIQRSTRTRQKRIHHIDPHPIAEGRWLACGDSFRTGPVIGLRY